MGWCHRIIEIYAKRGFEYPILLKSIWGIDINTIHFERQMSKCRKRIFGDGTATGAKTGLDPLAGIVGLIMWMGFSGACHWQLSPFSSSQPNPIWVGLLSNVRQFLALCPDSVFYFLCTSRRRPRPYWHSNILREFPANKYRRTSTSHSCPHYQHMRGRGNKWDIWQSEEHSNIATQTQTGWRRGGRGGRGRGVNRKIPYFPLNEFSNRIASTPANSLR